MATLVDSAKRRAKLLMQRLKELGADIKHTQALEALAASEDFSDWNRYQAHLLRHNPALDLDPSLNVVALRPGMGKTTAALAQVQARRSVGPILWINVVKQPLPQDSLAQGDREITVVYGNQGIKEPLPSLEGAGLTVVDLEADSEVRRFTPAGQLLLEDALTALLRHVRACVAQGLQVATVVLDEASPLSRSWGVWKEVEDCLNAVPAQWWALLQANPFGAMNQLSSEPPLAGAVRVWAEDHQGLTFREWKRETNVAPALFQSLNHHFQMLQMCRLNASRPS